jgi:hypothetical protein
MTAHAATRGFMIKAETKAPCDRYTIDRVEPQVGQGTPVSALNVQAGVRTSTGRNRPARSASRTIPPKIMPNSIRPGVLLFKTIRTAIPLTSAFA